MTIQGARMANRTVDVLDGDRHDTYKNQNTWSWVELESMHMSAPLFHLTWGNPKAPWFAGEWRNKEGYRHYSQDYKTVEKADRRGQRGKWQPALGHGKRILEEKKRLAKEAAAAAGAGAKKAKKK